MTIFGAIIVICVCFSLWFVIFAASANKIEDDIREIKKILKDCKERER